MPNDAKFGLLVGLSLVLTVALVFFQKEPSPPVATIPGPVHAKSTLPPRSSPGKILTPAFPVSSTGIHKDQQP